MWSVGCGIWCGVWGVVWVWCVVCSVWGVECVVCGCGVECVVYELYVSNTWVLALSVLE